MTLRPSLVVALLLTAAPVSEAGELFLASPLDQPVLRGPATELSFAPAFPFGRVEALASDGGDQVWIVARSQPGAAERLIRVDAPTGAVVTELASPAHVRALAVVGGGLWLALEGKRIVKVDAATGQVQLDWRVGFLVDAVAIAGKRMYVTGPSGVIRSTDLGAPNWQTEATLFGQPGHALAVRGSQLLVGAPGHVYIFERDTGILLYGYHVPNDAVSIVVDGNDALIAGRDGTIVRADPTTGEVVEVVPVASGGLSKWPISAATIVHAAPLTVITPSSAFASISAPSATSMRLEVSDEFARSRFFILGSLSGPTPGFFVDGVHVPLNVDAYMLAGVAGAGLIEGALGTFSSQNALDLPLADAQFKMPLGAPPSAAGLTLHHAFVVFDPDTLAPLRVSNVQRIIVGF